MSKTLLFTVAAVSLTAVPALAADTGVNPSKEPGAQMQTEGKMNPTAGQGASSNQQPGSETSDRTPQKVTPTPQAQVDRSTGGETSDRTPGRHKK